MGAGLEITRSDFTSAELRALSGRCTDGAQVRRLLALVLDGRSRTEAVPTDEPAAVHRKCICVKALTGLS